MATPFSFTGALNLVPADGLPQDPIPINMSGQFTSLAEFKLSVSGTGTKTLDLGTISSPGVKGLLVTLDAGASVTPITVKLNGSSSGGTEISAGGFKAVGSPNPSAGITGIVIDYTSTCTIRVWVLG